MKGNQCKKRGIHHGSVSGAQGRIRNKPGETWQGRVSGFPTDGKGATTVRSYCLCLQCGHREPHKRSIPCMQARCAQCGAVMIRA